MPRDLVPSVAPDRAEGVRLFLEAVARTPDLWRSIDVRVLAVNIAGVWHNLLTRCYLDARPTDSVTRFASLPVTDCVGCWQWALSAQELPRLLDSVAEGKLSNGDVVVQYRAPLAPSADQPYSFGGYGFSDLSESRHRSYRYWTCHALKATGNLVQDLVWKAGGPAMLDNAVRVSAVPYDGLDGLARYAVASPGTIDTQNCMFEVFAPLEVVIAAEHCSFDKGVLRYALRAGSMQAASRSQLGLFGLGSGPVPLHRVVKPEEGVWRRNGDQWEIQADLDLGDWRVATLMLAVGPYAVHRVTLRDVSQLTGNPRVEAYRVLDPDLALLRENLSTQGSEGTARFDASFARVLGFLGLVVNQLSGDSRLGEGVDLLGHAISENVCLVVECTTSALGSGGKLTKLVARVDALRRALPDVDVRGVMATALTRSQVAQADAEAAAADSLAVVCQEDLEEMLRLALGGARVGETLAFLQTRIPPQRKSLQASARRRSP